MSLPLKARVLPALTLTLILVQAAALCAFGTMESLAASEITPGAPRLIAHAGGDVYGIRMTNSLQAMDNSYDEGFRIFEADISFTSDGVPVLAHDWGNANWFMDIEYSKLAPTHEEFKSREPILGLEMMDMDRLAVWLAEHSDAYVITDVKADNIYTLSLIKEKYPDIIGRLIPQIYSFHEYDKVKELGYSYIILTLYRMKYPADEVYKFCENHPLFALTLTAEKAAMEAIEKYSGLGIPIYAHTVNDYNEYIKLRDLGIHGVYTDYFEPAEWVE